MLSALRYFIIIALLAFAAVWLAEKPGSVSLEWAGYQVETSFGVLAVAVGAVAVLSALSYRLWLFIMRAPGSVRGAWRSNRRNKGFQALTKGMVAVAAGDAEEAKRQAKRAEGILSDPPLTMLLSAQAAQLSGDERAAERFFKAMTDNHETEFLGLRGLLNQAMARGDSDDAIALARRAHRLKPNSEWVSKSLFELQTRSGQWLDASVTTREASRNKQLSSDVSHRRQAVLAYQLSMQAEARGDQEEALKQARAALDQDSTFLPAILGAAHLWNDLGKLRKASALIEKVWAKSPHPDLVTPYINSRAVSKPLEIVKAIERLIGFNKGHIESDLALARVALDADLWGQARADLETAIEKAPSARVFRIMAELEEAEHNDLNASRVWLVKAANSDPDPAYVCAHCGDTVRHWVGICESCQSFDAYEWRVPPHVVAPIALLASQDSEAQDVIDKAQAQNMVIEHDVGKAEEGRLKPFSTS